MDAENELLILRRRLDAIQDKIDNISNTNAANPPSALGTVYDGGSIPTEGLPKYFLTYPTRVAGEESEGSNVTYIVDQTKSRTVAVFGGNAPIVGDRLISWLVGSRWVSILPQTTKKPACKALWDAFCKLAPGTHLFLTTKTGTYTLNDARGASCSNGGVLNWNATISYPANSVKSTNRIGIPPLFFRIYECGTDTVSRATVSLTISPVGKTAAACVTLTFTEQWECCIAWTGPSPASAYTCGRRSPSSQGQPPGFLGVNANVVSTAPANDVTINGASILANFTLPPSPSAGAGPCAAPPSTVLNCPPPGTTLLNAGAATVST